MKRLVWKKVKISQELMHIFVCYECGKSRYQYSDDKCQCMTNAELDAWFKCRFPNGLPKGISD